MKLIERNLDLVTGSSKMEDLHSMKNFPVFMGCVEHPESEDIFAELTWQISKDSGFIQLKKLIPLDILYQAQHAGAVGEIWKEHHRKFSNFLNRNKPSSVLEIGGAHGILSKEYKKYGEIPWTILEPNPAPIDGCDAKFIKGFFDDEFSYDEYIDTVVHSHVFEHIYEPNQFMHHLARFIDEGKKLVFSLPNMQEMLERKYTNCINFEHTIFLTEPYVEYLLAKHGFKLLNKEYFMDNHSIFYAASRDSTVKPIELPSELYENNKLLYNSYVKYHQDLISYINLKIGNIETPIYLFGAHVFAQYLIESGLDISKVVSLLDNDPAKQGKRLYGTSLMVQSPKALRDVLNPTVILKAGVYNTEIKKDILENINSSVKFLE
jgi:SAM-dependent methyltransferase